MQVRKKENLEALQLTQEVKGDFAQLKKFIPDLEYTELHDWSVNIGNRNWRHTVRVGDWIVKDPKGKITIVRELDFEMNYEVVEG